MTHAKEIHSNEKNVTDPNVVEQVSSEIVDSLKFKKSCESSTPIPEYDNLIELIHRLKAIVYPVFHVNEPSREIVSQRLVVELNDVRTILSQQISRAIARHAESCEDMMDEGCDKQLDIQKSKSLLDGLKANATGLADRFLLQLPRIRASLLNDVTAAYKGDPACKNYDEVILCYPGLQAVTVYRLAHELYLMDVPFLARMMTEWVHGETGVDIHPGATIGDHFFIDHGTGVVIGETCVIGEHVKIYQGVTLGALSFPQDERGELVRNTKRHPTLEDNVVIYANATVLGGNTLVGHDSVIGSSVWLTESVDPFTTVTMMKPKLRIRNQNPSQSDFDPPIDFQI